MMATVQDYEHVARQYSTEVIIGALALHGVINATDMLSDMIQDPAYVREYGLPTQTRVVGEAESFVLHTLPDMIMDNEEFDGPLPGVSTTPVETKLDYLLRLVIRKILEPGSKHLKLQYRVPVDQPE
jgi:hypothetical protein